MSGNASHIANINQYRYRSYRYDTEIGLYYLNSRYYSPEWSRFLNADGLIDSGHTLLGHNMYIYCNNNPTTYCDPTGTLSKPVPAWSVLAQPIPPREVSRPEQPSLYENVKKGVAIVTNENEKTNMSVLIIDYRGSTNPNFQIVDSYKITSLKRQKEILQVMIDFNNLYPTNDGWNRSIESMQSEWDMHNFAVFYFPENWSLNGVSLKEHAKSTNFDKAAEFTCKLTWIIYHRKGWFEDVF